MSMLTLGMQGSAVSCLLVGIDHHQCMTNPHPPRYRNLEKLYPGLSEEEYVKLDEFYEGYASLIYRMYLRMESDPEAMKRFRELSNKPDPSGATKEENISPGSV